MVSNSQKINGVSEKWKKAGFQWPENMLLPTRMKDLF